MNIIRGQHASESNGKQNKFNQLMSHFFGVSYIWGYVYIRILYPNRVHNKRKWFGFFRNFDPKLVTNRSYWYYHFNNPHQLDWVRCRNSYSTERHYNFVIRMTNQKNKNIRQSVNLEQHKENSSNIRCNRIHVSDICGHFEVDRR